MLIPNYHRSKNQILVVITDCKTYGNLMTPDALHQQTVAPFVPLMIVMGLAFIIPTLARRCQRIPVPIVVWEIVCGAIIGKSGFDLIIANPSLEFLSELGFAFLMFLSGLEVDLTLLKPSRGTGRSLLKSPMGIALQVFIITLVLAVSAAYSMYYFGIIERPILMALILSTTSLGLVVPTLQQSGNTSTPFGQTILAAAVLADFITLFLITFVTGILVGGLTLDLFLGFGLVIVFVILLRLAKELKTRWKAFVGKSRDNSAVNTEVRGSVTLMLCLVAIAEALGTEVILGAFLSGILLGLLTDDKSKTLHSKLEALGFGFFIPVFFILVGARLNIHDLFGESKGWLLAPLLIIVAFLIKLIAALPFRLIVGWRETLAAGFLMSSRLSLIIAAAEIGLRLGLISNSIYAAVLCVAIVTCITGPSMFQVLMPPLKKAGRRILIVGTGPTGSMLAERLLKQNWHVSIATTREQSLIEARLPESVTIIQRRDEDDLTDLAEAKTAGVLVAATSSDEYNARICQAASETGIVRAIAIVKGADTSKKLQEAGIPVINPLRAEVALLDLAVTNPALFEVLVNQEINKQFAEAILRNKSLNRRAIRSIQWPGDVLIFSIVRQSEALVPDGNTELKMGDHLVLTGTPPHVERAVSYLEGT